MLELTLRVVFSLSVVLGLVWFVARASTKRFGGAARSMVRVVARQPLARSASLAVVEVGERVLVVGISENGVRLLTEMDPSELPVEAAEGTPARQPALAPSATSSPVPSPVTVVGGARKATPTHSLGGSVLSGQTWRQAWAAATGRTGGSSA